MDCGNVDTQTHLPGYHYHNIPHPLLKDNNNAQIHRTTQLLIYKAGAIVANKLCVCAYVY